MCMSPNTGSNTQELTAVDCSSRSIREEARTLTKCDSNVWTLMQKWRLHCGNCRFSVNAPREESLVCEAVLELAEVLEGVEGRGAVDVDGCDVGEDGVRRGLK